MWTEVLKQQGGTAQAADLPLHLAMNQAAPLAVAAGGAGDGGGGGGLLPCPQLLQGAESSSAHSPSCQHSKPGSPQHSWLCLPTGLTSASSLGGHNSVFPSF